VHVAGPQREGEPQLYQPILQHGQTLLYFVLRTSRAPETLLPAVRDTVRAIDPRLPLGKLGVFDDMVATAVAKERFNTWLFGAFGLVALVLAAVGLYGVMAFLVTQRTREIGIRLALGGQPGRVLRRVMREGLLMTAAGVVIGLLAALSLSQLVSGMLFGVEPTDPPTYAGIALLLLTAALVASYAPARRATRVDPVEILRF